MTDEYHKINDDEQGAAQAIGKATFRTIAEITKALHGEDNAVFVQMVFVAIIQQALSLAGPLGEEKGGEIIDALCGDIRSSFVANIEAGNIKP